MSRYRLEMLNTASALISFPWNNEKARSKIIELTAAIGDQLGMIPDWNLIQTYQINKKTCSQHPRILQKDPWFDPDPR